MARFVVIGAVMIAVVSAQQQNNQQNNDVLNRFMGGFMNQRFPNNMNTFQQPFQPQQQNFFNVVPSVRPFDWSSIMNQQQPTDQQQQQNPQQLAFPNFQLPFQNFWQPQSTQPPPPTEATEPGPSTTTERPLPVQCILSQSFSGLPCFGSRGDGFGWNQQEKKCVKIQMCINSWGNWGNFGGFTSEAECQATCDANFSTTPGAPTAAPTGAPQ